PPSLSPAGTLLPSRRRRTRSSHALSLGSRLKVAKVYRGWTAWRAGSLHDARRTGEVPGPVQGVRPRDEPAGTAGGQDRRGPDEGGAARRVQGGFRMARRDDGDSAELVYERMGPGTSRR